MCLHLLTDLDKIFMYIVTYVLICRMFEVNVQFKWTQVMYLSQQTGINETVYKEYC